jgi:hypothetical protein
MKTYRIIEERNSRLGSTVFYIQAKRRFLFYTWWERVTERTYLSSGEGYNRKPAYADLDAAKKELDNLMNEVEYIIHP